MMEKEKYKIYGMSCASCQAHVQTAVEKLKGIHYCNVNLLLNSMEVSYDDNILNSKLIVEAVKKAGYKAKLENKNNIKSDSKEKTVDKDLIKLIISIFFLVLLMYFSMGHMVGLPLPSFLLKEENSMYLALIQLFLTLPSVIIYFKYFISGYQKLFKLKPNMDSLVALGASASLIYGLVAISMLIIAKSTNNSEMMHNYMHNLYFESAATILTLVSLGKYLEKLSKKKTTLAIEKLIDLSPKKARILEQNGEEKEILANQVKIKQIVIVKKGEAIPVDGLIIEGQASIDESNINGESIPLYKKEGDKVYSSTIISSGYIKIKATKVGEDTSINKIIRLVEEASASKAPISKLVDKISLFFVPTIMLISLISFICFILSYKNFELAFNIAISVLVIACPCALGLATPVAIMVASGKAAENGLIIKNAEILEKTHLIKTIVLDKTGTITEGKPEMIDFICLSNEKKKDDILSNVYSLESLSEHPLSNAINDYCQKNNIEKKDVLDYKTIEGIGIKGKVDNKVIYIGNKKIIEENDTHKDELIKLLDRFSSEGKTVLFIKENENVVALLTCKDKVKQNSKEAINKLHKLGIKVIMLTGDNLKTANSIAKECNIDEVYAEVLPIQKQEIIKKLKIDKKHLVSMVGDGVNDALALTSSDLGIALESGSDAAIECADIVLKRNDLLDVYYAIKLSKRTYATIITNLFWAFIYNIIGVILASGIFYPAFKIKLTPMIGSLAMSFSSVFVVLNALTINLFKKKEGKQEMKEIKLEIEGMMCEHCVKHVTEALKSNKNVEAVKVDLKNKQALIKGSNLNVASLIKSVTDIGYKAKEIK